jgi:hypothetical protein
METVSEVLKRVLGEKLEPKPTAGIQPQMGPWRQRRVLIVSRDVLLPVDDDGTCTFANHLGSDMESTRFHRYRDPFRRLVVMRCPKGLLPEERLVRMVEDIPPGHARNAVSAVLGEIAKVRRPPKHEKRLEEASWK